jgi:hypothetical protein
MGGGLLQLIEVGQIDQYLTVNPEISFFQYVYKRHTNFAMESRILIFDKSPELSTVSALSTYDCEIKSYGDLLSHLYFCFTLPEIYSSSEHRFRWVKNVGTVFVKKANVHINGMVIDQTTGEWMNVWNELTLPAGENKYDKLIGNDPDMQDPKASFTRVSIVNNKFVYFYYPEATKGKDPPSIPSKLIIVPLNFWFTRNPALALPLFKLRKGLVTVSLELQSSEMLYQVYSNLLDMYVSPTYYNEIHNSNINIGTFADTVKIQPYIDANYIFLANEERDVLLLKSEMNYLIEQLTISLVQNAVPTSSSVHNINVMVNNPTKELVWTIKRDDLWKFNDFSNYTPSIPEGKTGILDKATIRFFSNNRIEEKPAEYFNLIQPYQHHTKIPKPGIYCYSFDLYPEKEILSGYYNAATVQTNLLLQFKPDYNNDLMNRKLAKIGKATYNYNYDVCVYALNYNMFQVRAEEFEMKLSRST